MKKTRMTALFIALLLISSAYAEEKKWGDIAELSYVETGGNTDVRTFSFNNSLKYGFSKDFLGSWKITSLTNETEGKKTAEQFFTSFRLNYNLYDNVYALTDASWFQDKFAGIDNRYIYALGLGYAVLSGSKHKLNTEAGVNYTSEEFTNGTDNDYSGGRLFVHYTYIFNDKNKLSQSVEYLHDFENPDNYMINTETSLVSTLNSFLSFKTSYSTIHDNEPAAGKKETDSKVLMALVMNF